MKKHQEKIIITDPDRDRDNALKNISWWDNNLLKKAKVGVIGVGALGNEVVKNLALMGVGNIFLADFDEVQISNLSRSILFRREDAGKRKVDVASTAIKKINPEIKISKFHGNIRNKLGLGVYKQLDVIVSCVDSRAARVAINKACAKVGVPWVDGAMTSLYGWARTFWSKNGPCYECTLFDEDYKLLEERKPCQGFESDKIIESRIPTTPTTTSVIGGVLAQEVLKVISANKVNSTELVIKDFKPGNLFVFDGHKYEAYWLSFPKKENCYGHEEYSKINKLPNASSSEITLNEFFEIIKGIIPGKEYLVQSDYLFIRQLYCPICGKTEIMNKPQNEISFEEVLCCGEERRSEPVFMYSETDSECSMILQDLGIPDFHILHVLVDEADYFFELSGDKNKFKFA